VSRNSPAGAASVRFRPMKSPRSHVKDRDGWVACQNATRSLNSVLYAFLARIAPVDSCSSETTNRRSPYRGGPSTHSTYPKMLKRRVALDVFVSVSSDNLTG